jgi:hypothetical protein
MSGECRGLRGVALLAACSGLLCPALPCPALPCSALLCSALPPARPCSDLWPDPQDASCYAAFNHSSSVKPPLLH